MIDFDGTLNDAISATLGDETPIVFLPKAGGSFPGITGVFTQITDHIFDADGEPDANITVATLGAQTSQFSALNAPVPVQSDRFQIGGVAYVVKDVAVDGLGWAYIDLGKQ
ncbi:hypothetical protein G3N59_01305 [Paraburkholderia sp. Ac-20340]|uniref:head-tail joining protein n=1 Tax=Paraburkholderia sp. Ac-20340 TaxID=2703888 RepID=UPI00197FCD8E|nr:hypothetical protein [Paraburkholderia sp. Ac-20340]MBN3852005.1 hypothetical protein [Paraburkholderia sp. Ac-20340]